MKTRYITIQSDSCITKAYTPEEPWRKALDAPDVAEWIWQYAESKEQAIAQHNEMHDEWTRTEEVHA